MIPSPPLKERFTLNQGVLLFLKEVLSFRNPVTQKKRQKNQVM